MRAFISVDIEEEAALSSIGAVQSGLQGTGADLKFVGRENTHLTLLFLGEIPETMANAICAMLGNSTMPSVAVLLTGLGAFPNERFPRVVWLGIDDKGGQLLSYARETRAIVSKTGLRFKAEEFTPHLTIARVRSGRNRKELVDFVSKAKQTVLGETKTSPVRLKASDLTPRGPIYRTLCEATS